MSKVLYLFGAGASAQSLPIVQGIPKAFDEVIKYLEKDEFILSDAESFKDDFFKDSKRHFQNLLIDDIKWLRDKSANHASVDTFAKKLEITRNPKELKRLKVTLSAFFIIIQGLKKVDERYDAFFASIFNDIHKQPEDIRILSWNYDSQFEIAFSEYSGDKRLSSIKDSLNIKDKNSRLNSLDKLPFIFKINGTTDFEDSGRRSTYSFLDNLEFNEKSHEAFVEQFSYARYFNKLSSNLSFAWENWGDSRLGIEKIKSYLSDFKTLVVIGYSFPFFNRDVDRIIFSGLSSLNKIYVQDKHADGVIERIEAVLPGSDKVKIIPINNCEQFYLPNEL
jgi:hypothetical protein